MDPGAADRDEGRSMPYCRGAELAALFERVGRDVRGGDLTARASNPSFDDLIDPLASGVGRAGAQYGALDAGGRRRSRRSCEVGSASATSRSAWPPHAPGTPPRTV